MAIALDKAMILDPNLTAEKVKRLGARIKDRRQFLGMTRGEVATYVPFSVGKIERIENGLMLPEPEDLRMLAMALRCQDRLDILHGNMSFYVDAKYWSCEEQEEMLRKVKGAFKGNNSDEGKLSLADSKIVGKRVKKTRTMYKDSLVWLAMQIGISDSRLRNCELGQTRFFESEVQAICKVYSKSLSPKKLYEGTSLAQQ